MLNLSRSTLSGTAAMLVSLWAGFAAAQHHGGGHGGHGGHGGGHPGHGGYHHGGGHPHAGGHFGAGHHHYSGSPYSGGRVYGSGIYGGAYFGGGYYASPYGYGSLSIRSYGAPGLYAVPGAYVAPYPYPAGTAVYGVYPLSAYSAPLYPPPRFRSTPAYPYGAPVELPGIPPSGGQPSLAGSALPSESSEYSGQEPHVRSGVPRSGALPGGELRPGMVLPDGSVVISVGPAHPATGEVLQPVPGDGRDGSVESVVPDGNSADDDSRTDDPDADTETEPAPVPVPEQDPLQVPDDTTT